MRKNNVSLKTILLVTTLCLTGCNDKVVDKTSEDSSSNISTSIESSSSFTESSTIESSTVSTSDSTTSSIESSSSMESSSIEETSNEYQVNNDFAFPDSENSTHPTVEEMHALDSYTPTTFDTSTYSKNKLYSVVDGLDVYCVKYTLNGSVKRNITTYFFEINLKKVNIVGGSYNNTTTAQFATRSIPTDMADAWERDNSGKNALLTINADFFGSTCVNAFVKDGIILKDSHNNDSNDLPKSSPMLFGVSTAGARIGAMTTSGNRTLDYTSKLYYGSCIDFYDENGNCLNYASGGNNDAANKIDSFCVIDKAGTYTIPAGMLYKFKKVSSSTDEKVKGCIVEVTELSKLKGLRVTSTEINDGYGYIGIGKYSDIGKLEVGTYFQQNEYLASPSNTWDYYDTILGCRHSILENGSIPSTVAQEGGTNGNSAEYACARSCVGIKPDGTVVIFSLEDFIRNSSNVNCNGLNLCQVADVMRYYGIYDAANFDGGGSTQVCTKVPGEDWKVVVRSSDTQSYDHSSTRKVLNSLIVTTK